MNTLMAIDPGDTQSAWVIYDLGIKRVVVAALEPNEQLLTRLAHPSKEIFGCVPPDVLVIEMVASYGMPVGRTIFDTVVWIGRFYEAWARSRADTWSQLLTRKSVKMHLCGSTKAKDSNIAQAIFDRYGGDSKRAKGTKKAPGPLYGFHGDMFAALAVAITAAETEERYSLALTKETDG